MKTVNEIKGALQKSSEEEREYSNETWIKDGGAHQWMVSEDSEGAGPEVDEVEPFVHNDCLYTQNSMKIDTILALIEDLTITHPLVSTSGDWSMDMVFEDLIKRINQTYNRSKGRVGTNRPVHKFEWSCEGDDMQMDHTVKIKFRDIHHN